MQLLLLPPAWSLVTAFGRTASQRSWLPDDNGDPWGRAPSFMGYDIETKAMVRAEPRAFMSGLSDEAGAAMPLAMASKLLGRPDAEEIEKLEAYVHETLIQGNGSQPGKRQYVQVGPSLCTDGASQASLCTFGEVTGMQGYSFAVTEPILRKEGIRLQLHYIIQAYVNCIRIFSG